MNTKLPLDLLQMLIFAISLVAMFAYSEPKTKKQIIVWIITVVIFFANIWVLISR